MLATGSQSLTPKLYEYFNISLLKQNGQFCGEDILKGISIKVNVYIVLQF